jgi:hypothetical protein
MNTRFFWNLRFFWAAAGLLLGLSGGGLAQNADPLPLPVSKPAQVSQKKEAVLPVRSESLEIPGLTACHQCEWRPKPHQMAAQDKCGLTLDGKPAVAEFECGFSQECDRVCNFVRCLSQ